MSGGPPALRADFVVVGAGSAGCVLANRLSAGDEHRVLLIEAGPPDRSPWIHLPAGAQRAIGDARVTAALATEPEPGMQGRRIPVPRGRTLGGCSAINAMLYVRGQPEDYDAWAALGCEGWSWSDVLPYFKRAEANDRGANALHGGEGPLRVSSVRERSTLALAFIDAARACGIAAVEDFNTARQEGAGFYQYTGWRGRRHSAAVAYLGPARGRANLRVETGAQAASLRFDGARATGVEYIVAGERRVAVAQREVILAAGAIGSPQLLMLSGIGAHEELARHGIKVRLERPAVGADLQDHLQARLLYEASAPITLNDFSRSPMRMLAAVLRYAATRRGLLAEPPIKCGAFARSEAGLERPDVQFHLLEFSSDGPGKAFHPFPGFFISVCFLRPESRGRVQLASAEPLAPARITHNYLDSPLDRARTLAGVRLARRIAAAQPLAALIRRELQPGPALADEEGLLGWIRTTALSVYHQVGTCRMGSDERAVVDSRLRVRGLERLRIADGSVMPRLVSGNTNAPIIMIAEKAADMILADARIGV